MSYDLSESYPEFPKQTPQLHPALLEEVTKEVYLSRGCDRTELVLSCPKNTMLLIVSASFSPQLEHKLNCTDYSFNSEQIFMHNNNRVLGEDRKDLRRALNRRCSGYSGEECRFSLLLDQPEARLLGRRFSGGETQMCQHGENQG